MAEAAGTTPAVATSALPAAAKSLGEPKIARVRRSLPLSRAPQLASLTAAPAVSAPPPRRRAAAPASQRRQVAALEKRRVRKEPPRNASRPQAQTQQQRLADLDDFDEDVRPTRTMRRFAAGRPRYYED